MLGRMMPAAKFLTLALTVALITHTSATTARAQPARDKAEIRVEGTISVVIGGKKITGKTAGVLDPASGTGKVVAQNPPGWAADRHGQVAHSWLCLICCIFSCSVNDGAQNLMAITGGNYTLKRTYTYPDNRRVELSGQVTFDGKTIRYESEFSGDFGPDPTGWQDVLMWQRDLIPAGSGVMRETGAAIVGSGKQTAEIKFTGEYRFKGNLASPQHSEVAWRRMDNKLDGGRSESTFEWKGNTWNMEKSK